MTETLGDHTAATEWDRLRPVIDDALHGLSERDREAVLLRFIAGHPFAEVGRRISASEDAARVRVDRALEKMRVGLARRGVTSTTAALGVALAGQTAAAAPAGLAATVTGTALAGATGGGVMTVFAFMSMNKISLGLSAAFVAAGATGFVVQARTNTELQAELQQLQVENRQFAVLEAENLRLAKSAAEVEAMRGDEAALAQLGEEATALQGRMQAAAKRAEQVRLAKTIYDPRELDHPPRLRSHAAPQYPAELKQAGVAGEVVVDFVVDATGKVHNAYVISSTQREFETPTVDAVAKWEFDPGQHAGRAVNTHMQVPVKFTLAQGKADVGEPTPYSPGKTP